MEKFYLNTEENTVFNSIDEEFKKFVKSINSSYNGSALIAIDTKKTL